MAIYLCEECEQFIDDDWHPMELVGDSILCPSCYERTDRWSESDIRKMEEKSAAPLEFNKI